MTVMHEPWLVVLSLIVAFQGSFVGLTLGVQVTNAEDPRRRFLLASAALTLALAIWSMHFVGMLAARLPVAVDFLVLPTLLSFLICVLVVGIAVFFASSGPLTRVRLGLSALVMGAGICTMHYLGMYALHSSLHMEHDGIYVVGSFLVAVSAAGLALWLSFGDGKSPPIIITAVIQALAISAMHYMAMAGVRFHAKAEGLAQTAPAVSPGTLAIIVACVAFLVSGLFLLTLVPSRAADAAPYKVDGVDHVPVQPQATTTHDPESREIQGARRAPSGLQAAPGQRPGTSFARRLLPIERDGAKGQINANDVVAVQADAHYTQLFDGARSLFCPLAISEVEQQLDPKVFSRVHRSHIANMERVASFKRSGDGGTLVMKGESSHCVPVSRSRWSSVKARLGNARTPDAADLGAVPTPAAAE